MQIEQIERDRKNYANASSSDWQHSHEWNWIDGKTEKERERNEDDVSVHALDRLEMEHMLSICEIFTNKMLFYSDVCFYDENIHNFSIE